MSGAEHGTASGGRDLSAVARYQKFVIGVIALYLVMIALSCVVSFALTGGGGAGGGGAGGPGGGGGGAIVAGLPVVLGTLLVVAQIVSVLLLMGALGIGVVWRVLAAIAMFFPLIGLIVLLVVNGRATQALRDGGHSVGLFGAKGYP